MRCAGCDVEIELHDVFPGGSVTCPACGATNRAPLAAVASAAGSGPYRAPDVRATLEPPDLACPFCGGACRPDARACPHCDVKLSNVRCPTCFALQTTGERTCKRCGHELELEPVLDPTDAPCPRCDKKLESLGDRGMQECPGCGGIFVDHASLARIVEERDKGGPLPVPDARPFERARHAIAEVSVHYVKCPMCRQTMNRVNFGRRSGVVVDVCKPHGTWFDAGELTQAIEWVSSGGLELAKKQRGAMLAAKTERLTAAEAIAQVEMINGSMREMRDVGRRVALTEGLVDAAIRALLWW